MTVTYWHIAHPKYPGGDLLCRDYLVRDGAAPEWMWGDDAPEGFDGNVVCLFPDSPRGRTEADWLWFERKDYHLLRVELPDHVEVGQGEEGYPAVVDHIPAEYVTLVRTGYAERAVTRDGDEH